MWLKLKVVFSSGGEEPQPQRYRELKWREKPIYFFLNLSVSTLLQFQFMHFYATFFLFNYVKLPEIALLGSKAKIISKVLPSMNRKDYPLTGHSKLNLEKNCSSHDY